MPATVYFVDARSRNTRTNTLAKMNALLKKLIEDHPDAIKAGELCAIKIHFGELGNDGYISPVHAKTAAALAKDLGAKPFFSDTNTLYSGSRSNAVAHLNTASAHGFVPEVCGAPVIIADGLKSADWRDSPLPPSCKHFKAAKIASAFLDADSMIVLSHFKGHEMAGFGGAIKNLAMGCAPYQGKREQHSVKFQVKEDKCVSCGACVPVCPSGAISLDKGAKASDAKASIDLELCIGCGECLSYCATKAIRMDWNVALPEFTQKMTEYALGAVQGKAGKVLYLSAVKNVVPDCDCTPWSDAPVVPDLGYLASTDPVAIDQAAFDLVRDAPVRPGSALDGKAGAGDDKFKALHPETMGELQLSYGQAIGLGTREYTLVRL
jgi:uncharacterized Fe-S center protein